MSDYIPAPPGFVAEMAQTADPGPDDARLYLSVVGFNAETGEPVVVPRRDFGSDDFGELVACFQAPDLIPGRPGGNR